MNTIIKVASTVIKLSFGRYETENLVTEEFFFVSKVYTDLVSLEFNILVVTKAFQVLSLEL